MKYSGEDASAKRGQRQALQRAFQSLLHLQICGISVKLLTRKWPSAVLICAQENLLSLYQNQSW